MPAASRVPLALGLLGVPATLGGLAVLDWGLRRAVERARVEPYLYADTAAAEIFWRLPAVTFAVPLLAAAVLVAGRRPAARPVLAGLASAGVALTLWLSLLYHTALYPPGYAVWIGPAVWIGAAGAAAAVLGSAVTAICLWLPATARALTRPAPGPAMPHQAGGADQAAGPATSLAAGPAMADHAGLAGPAVPDHAGLAVGFAMPNDVDPAAGPVLPSQVGAAPGGDGAVPGSLRRAPWLLGAGALLGVGSFGAALALDSLVTAYPAALALFGLLILGMAAAGGTATIAAGVARSGRTGPAVLARIMAVLALAGQLLAASQVAETTVISLGRLPRVEPVAAGAGVGVYALTAVAVVATLLGIAALGGPQTERYLAAARARRDRWAGWGSPVILVAPPGWAPPPPAPGTPPGGWSAP